MAIDAACAAQPTTLNLTTSRRLAKVRRQRLKTFSSFAAGATRRKEIKPTMIVENAAVGIRHKQNTATLAAWKCRKER